MDLGTKIKNALRDTEPDDNPQAKHEYSPPGSYPVDDFESGTSHSNTVPSSEQNKLHKSNDPRAGSSGKKTHGHRHTDSGVGLADARDPTDVQSATRLDTQPATIKPDATTSLGEKQDVGAKAETSGMASLASHQADTPMNERNLQREDADQDDANTKDHPYWGDLPRILGGVYNSVVGHGSPEDENKRHQEIHQGQSSTQAAVPPSHTTGHGPTTAPTQRTMPLGTDRTSAEGPRAFEDEQNKTSKGAAVATAAGITGLGAHELNKAHRESHDHEGSPVADNSPHPRRAGDNNPFGDSHREPRIKSTDVAQEGKHTKPLSQADHSHTKGAAYAKEVKKPETSEGKNNYNIFGLFSGGSKAKGKEDVADDKQAREGENASYLHDGGSEEKHALPGPTTQKTEKTGRESRDYTSAAALGAGGMAAYAASQIPGHDHEAKDTDQHRANPQPSSTGQGNHGDISRTAKSGNPTGARSENFMSGHQAMPVMAGVGAGAVASSGIPGLDARPSEPSTARGASRGTQGEQYNVLASGRPSGIKVEDANALPRNKASTHSNMSHNYQPAVGSGAAAAFSHGSQAPKSHNMSQSLTGHQGEFNRVPIGQRGANSSSQPLNKGEQVTEASRHAEPTDKHHGAATATGLAVGVGTGALASHEMKGYQGNTKSPVEKATWKDTRSGARQAPSGEVPNTMATEIPNVPKQPHPRGAETSVSSHRTNQSPSKAHSSDSSHHGQYNILASGTPSGIRVNDTDDQSRPVPTNETRTTQERKHQGVKTAAVGLGAAGVGATAYNSQRPGEDKLDKSLGRGTGEMKPNKQQESVGQRQFEGPTFMGPTSDSNQTRVTHRCTRCGEENDITSYLKKM